MAEQTLAQIRTAVRFRGDYQNTRKFPNADVNREIQKSFDEFWQLVAEVNQGWWDEYGSVTTTANVEYVALPANAWAVQDVKRLDGGSYLDLRRIAAQQRSRYDSSTGEPRVYFLTARGIELGPVPDAAYTLRVLYTPKVAQLAEDTGREWYLGWDDYVIESTLAKLARREGSPLLRDHLDAVATIEARVRSGAGKRNEQEPEYLNLREGASGDIWDDGVY